MEGNRAGKPSQPSQEHTPVTLGRERGMLQICDCETALFRRSNLLRKEKTASPKARSDIRL